MEMAALLYVIPIDVPYGSFICYNNFTGTKNKMKKEKLCDRLLFISLPYP